MTLMRRKHHGDRRAALLAAILLLPISNTAIGAGDAKRGAQAFRQCMACHTVEAGEHLSGPSLAHIWNRKAGTVEGFQRYSEPMKRLDISWSDAMLDKWLSNPERFLPGTSMTFPGIRGSKDRQDIVAYLKAVAENKAPQIVPGGEGRMGMRAQKLDLRKAPPEGQVTSIKHCGDTYTVDTADGKSQKIWEFNLRFKTDSSKLGPLSRKPVVVGAGMQGDRASIIFASPQEISESVKQLCP